MMEDFVEKLYKSVGLKLMPLVVRLDDHAAFFENYSKYESRLGGVPLVHWPYCSSISMPVTMDDGFEGHAYKGDQLYENFWKASIEMIGDTKADKIVEGVFDQYPEIMEQLQLKAEEEFPSLALGIEGCIFLGPFAWLEADVAVFNKMKGQQPLSYNSEDELLECFSQVIEDRLFILTFNDLVFITQI